MTTIRTAAQQALEALRVANAALGHPDNIAIMESAIGALRSALAKQQSPLMKRQIINLWREPFERKDEDSWIVEFAKAVERAHGITGESDE
jgi:hypothetical protein